MTAVSSPPGLAIAGDVDEDTYPALLEKLEELTGRAEVHLYSADVEYCDLVGQGHDPAGSRGRSGHPIRRVVLHNVPPWLQAVLVIVGWDMTPGLVIEQRTTVLRSVSADLTAARLGVMAGPDAEVFDWASAVLDIEVTVLQDTPRRPAVAAASRGPRGGPPGRACRAGAGDGDRSRGHDLRGGARWPVATLPVAELLGYELAERTRYGLVLTTRVPGTSAIPPEPDPERLRALGAAAARISSIELAPARALPARSRPIEAEDFASMRREQGAPDLLRAAEAAVAATRPEDDQLGLVHGDTRYGNTLWDDGGADRGPRLGLRRSCRPRPTSTSARCAATRPGATAPEPPSTSCAAGRPRRAGPRATSPTGTPSRRSPPRRTWAGSRRRWPFRAAPT